MTNLDAPNFRLMTAPVAAPAGRALATLAAFRAMGVAIDGPTSGRVTIEGVGLEGLCAPARPLDLGNSGTSMRLLVDTLEEAGFRTAGYGRATEFEAGPW